MVDARHHAFMLEDTGTENPVPRTNMLVQPQAAGSKPYKLVANSIFGRRLRRKSVPQNGIVTFKPDRRLNGHDRFFNLLFHLPPVIAMGRFCTDFPILIPKLLLMSNQLKVSISNYYEEFKIFVCIYRYL